MFMFLHIEEFNYCSASKGQDNFHIRTNEHNLCVCFPESLRAYNSLSFMLYKRVLTRHSNVLWIRIISEAVIPTLVYISRFTIDDKRKWLKLLYIHQTVINFSIAQLNKFNDNIERSYEKFFFSFHIHIKRIGRRFFSI